MMKVTPLKIPDVKLIEPEVFGDERGFFTNRLTKKNLKRRLEQTLLSSKITTLSL